MLPPFSWAEQILLVLPAQGDAAELDPTWRKYLEESCTQSNTMQEGNTFTKAATQPSGHLCNYNC